MKEGGGKREEGRGKREKGGGRKKECECKREFVGKSLHA